MSRPLVTIVVPVYNGARYLRESLASIVGQTYTPLEIIVLDDASTDETPSIIASFADHVRSVRHPRNLGQFPNINAGLASSNPRYFTQVGGVVYFQANDGNTSTLTELSDHSR